MRKYFKRNSKRPCADFPLVKDARKDKRYFGSSFTNYYTEERGEIREKWQPEREADSNDKRCFALLRRCYALGMLVVNNVDLISAYSCLRANLKSEWRIKIEELLDNPLDLQKQPVEEKEISPHAILNLYEVKEIKVINPLPEIVWRDETEEYYWLPHSYSDFSYHKEFDEYVDGDLLHKLQKKDSKKKQKEMDYKVKVTGKDFMKELIKDATVKP